MGHFIETKTNETHSLRNLLRACFSDCEPAATNMLTNARGLTRKPLFVRTSDKYRFELFSERKSLRYWK
jgi:hypothetical protein